jgi:hypothetical protein
MRLAFEWTAQYPWFSLPALQKSLPPHCLSRNEFPQNTLLPTSHWLRPKPIQISLQEDLCCIAAR